MIQEQAEGLNPPKQPTRRIRPGSPPPLTTKIDRPCKQVFLVFFLLFAGLVFVFFSYEHYNVYTIWELFIVWLLALLLLIPGVYYSVLIFCIEFGIGGINYNHIPELKS